MAANHDAFECNDLNMTNQEPNACQAFVLAQGFHCSQLKNRCVFREGFERNDRKSPATDERKALDFVLMEYNVLGDVLHITLNAACGFPTCRLLPLVKIQLSAAKPNG